MSLKIQTVYSQACTLRVSGSEDPAGVWTNTSWSISLKFKQLWGLSLFKPALIITKDISLKIPDLIWSVSRTMNNRCQMATLSVSWSTSIFYKIKYTQLLYHLLVLLFFIFPQMKAAGDCVSGLTFSPSLTWSCHRYFQEPVLRADDLGSSLPGHTWWYQSTLLYGNTALYWGRAVLKAGMGL